MVKLIALATIAFSALLAHAQDFTGVGNIQVWNSSDWRTANPDKIVGCLDTKGKFLNPLHDTDCGVFTRINDYPYTLSSKDGNCTFNDETQDTNSDSVYGKSDHAWNCYHPYEAVIYDELYTIVRSVPFPPVATHSILILFSHRP